MKKNILLTVLLLCLIFASCGENLSDAANAEEKNMQIGFLLSIIGVIMALAIANLIKGFNVISKYTDGFKKSLTTKSRLQLRLLWGISLSALIFQLVWGMRLALEEPTQFIFFFYYTILVVIVYRIVVYVYPDDIEKAFLKEREKSYEKYWSKALIRRLYQLYYIYGTYILSTILMSIFFFREREDIILDINILRDGNLIGIVLKVIFLIILRRAILRKLQQEKDYKSSHTVSLDNGDDIILKLDYYVIAFSMLIHFYYILIRTYYLW